MLGSCRLDSLYTMYSLNLSIILHILTARTVSWLQKLPRVAWYCPEKRSELNGNMTSFQTCMLFFFNIMSSVICRCKIGWTIPEVKTLSFQSHVAMSPSWRSNCFLQLGSHCKTFQLPWSSTVISTYWACSYQDYISHKVPTIVWSSCFSSTTKNL